MSCSARRREGDDRDRIDFLRAQQSARAAGRVLAAFFAPSSQWRWWRESVDTRHKRPTRIRVNWSENSREVLAIDVYLEDLRGSSSKTCHRRHGREGLWRRLRASREGSTVCPEAPAADPAVVQVRELSETLAGMKGNLKQLDAMTKAWASQPLFERGSKTATTDNFEQMQSAVVSQR